MATASIEHDTHQHKVQTGKIREAARLVVHTVGNEAGLMRLEIDLPEFSETDGVSQSVRLLIPGETSPLNPKGVSGEDGRFIMTFFSSDIANSGHVPAAAVVAWEANGQIQHEQRVTVECVERVLEAGDETALDIPGGAPSVVYPKTVILMVLLAVGVLTVAAFANLM